ncbi:MAG: MFS transporter [Syntrophobacteraceae bacterium]
MQQSSTAISKRDFWITMSVAFAAFIVSLDHYVVNICLPIIAKDLCVGTNEVSRVAVVYFLVMATTLLIFAKVGDRIGLRPVFCLGYAVFGLGSLLCGISPSLNILLFSRCLQGIGGAMLYTSSFAIISRFLPPDITGRAFGILSTAGAFGIITGAPFGGFLAGFFNWHWVFLINVPLTIPAALIAMRVIPKEEVNPSGAEGSFDIPGAVMGFCGLLTLICALNVGHEMGWRSPMVLLSLGGSVAFLSAFTFRESRTRSPLIDPGIFKNLDFNFTHLATIMAIMFMAGSNFLIPFYLVDAEHLAVERAGMVLMVYSLAYIIVSPLAGWAADRVRPTYLCMVGMFSAASASVFFALFLRSSGLWAVICYLGWLGVSHGLFMSPNTKHVMSIFSSEKKGAVSGLFTTITMLGLVLGVSVFETVFSGKEPSGIILASATAIGKNTASLNQLFPAFERAYWLGGFFCMTAVVLIALAGRKQTPA